MRVLTHFALWTLGLREASTMYTDAECAALERHAAGKRRLVEIGCWHGVNTRRLRRVMAPDGVLYGIDPYAPGQLGFSAQRVIARREVAKERNGTMRWIRLTDLEAARALATEPPFDFIFSDTLNTFDGYRAAWEAWNPRLASGGVYALANSRSSPTRNLEDVGSARCTREVILKHPEFTVIDLVETFTLLQKR
jgi:predicted O-methyltransferase YrrM